MFGQQTVARKHRKNRLIQIPAIPHMKNTFRFINFTFVFVFFALAVSAQTPQATPPPAVDDAAGVSKTFEVRLPVTVLQKKSLVTGLTRGDFAIFEDGVQQEITFFTDEKTNPPVYVGVLMDTSDSTKGKMKFSKEAAKNFIYTVTRLRKDKAAFMTFDHEVKLIQDFTDKLDLLDKAVDKINKTGSQTALYDAVWQFSDEKLRNAPGRRVVVIITDGEDTFSRAELKDAIDIAQRTETTIFAISTKAGFLGSVPGVDAGTVKDKGDKYLTQLAEETGGEAFFTGDMLELEKAFKKISEELRSQYIITYRPANQVFDGRERKIEVRFTGKDKADKYKIRSKTSYRAVRDGLKQ
ncbi:MAG: von Willebrand factor type protein [Acidobacteria bacterium]|jgi:Ca-activated chloride channel family protein|nr:von Willebrand factor type protein [Acidobacteriota bacterium]